MDGRSEGLREESRLLGSQDLDRGRGLLGEVHEATRVRDEARPHQLPHNRCQVGRNRLTARATPLTRRVSMPSLLMRAQIALKCGRATISQAPRCVRRTCMRFLR